MLIRIDDSIVNTQDINALSDEVLLMLEILASARREGKHAVIAERQTLKHISQCEHLSKFARSVYSKLFNHFAQFQAYRSAVTKYIEIVNPCHEPQLIDTPDKKIIKVSPKFFQDSELVQKTLLLGENINDAAFYEIVAKTCLIRRGIRIQLSCEHRGGGGNTICDEYTNIQKNGKRLCLCIVDSDRVAPNGKLGSTANRIHSQNDPNCITTQLHILAFRELENLIPNSILGQLCLSSKERQNALVVLEEIGSSSALEIRSFLDIKKGSRMEEVVSSGDPNIRLFWLNKISSIPNISNRIDSWCESNWQCSYPRTCKCRISLGLGENILDGTINYISTISIHKVSQLVDDLVQPEWEKIGQVIIDWCFAESPIRA